MVGFFLPGSLALAAALPPEEVTKEVTRIESLRLQVDSLILQVQKLQGDLNATRSGTPLSSAVPSKLSVGSRVQAVDYLKVRTAPGSTVLTVVSPGSRGTILGGPTNYGSYTWWSVSYDGQIAGWSAESWLTAASEPVSTGRTSGGSDVVGPGSYTGVTKSALGLKVGDRVQVNEFVVVRLSASGSQLRVVAPGTKGTVAGVSEWVGEYWWANIYWDDRTRGFSAEDYLHRISMTVSGVCGDLNGDGVVNLLDSILMKSYWTGGVPVPAGVNADMNGDGVAADILDFSLLDAYALRGGPAPTCAATPVATEPFACGDVNKNGTINYGDVEELSLYVFGGKPIMDMNLVDLNRDGVPNVLDLTILTNHVNRGGPAPTCMPATEPGPVYACGDVDGDSDIDFSDVDALNAYVFQGADQPKGEADVNGDGAPNISDVIILSNYLKGRGAIPVCGKTVRSYQCGDLNLDGVINQRDIDYLTYYAFYNGTLPPGVSPDFNGDGVGNIVDVVRLIGHVNRGESAPTCYSGGSGEKSLQKSTPLLGASLLDVLISYLKSL